VPIYGYVHEAGVDAISNEKHDTAQHTPHYTPATHVLYICRLMMGRCSVATCGARDQIIGKAAQRQAALGVKGRMIRIRGGITIILEWVLLSLFIGRARLDVP
jgi:hypothetical protein